jgi:3-oxoacyl-[acyl-carrier-protein] synthase-1
VFAQAERLIRTGLADAAIVGGVDTLCGSVLFGFNSLELVSSDPCRPFDARRRGINLGEAAGFALLERPSHAGEGAAAWLLGYGESSDAYHMSTPHPQGQGAGLALRRALDSARLTPADIDYVNLHGTASQKNDEVEAQLVARTFPAHTFASSTKGWTGHTLGAAGIVEAVISLIALEHSLLPGTLNTEVLDPACGPQIQRDNRQRVARHALSFSFGFGGSNCVLALGHGDLPGGPS